MIADAIKQAQALARKAQEATYDGRCTVMEHQKAKDPKTKITTEKEMSSDALPPISTLVSTSLPNESVPKI